MLEKGLNSGVYAGGMKIHLLITLKLRCVMRTLALICSLLFSGCTTVYHQSNPVKVIDSEEMTWIVQKVMTKYKHAEGRRLKLEHSSTLYDKNIRGLRLEISSQEILEVNQARDLFVDLVEDFLKEINTNPIISNELSSYPFTPDQLDIAINFESFFGIYVDPFYVGCVEMKCGMVRYSAFDMKDRYWHSWHSRVEPYSKTREISILERAAEKDYQNARCPPRHLTEQFIPADENEIP